MVRASFLLFAAYGAGTVLSFLRNILIGRAVSVEDFGIVSTFSIGFAVIEMAIYSGLDRLIVQDREGGTERFQASLQGLQVVRCFFGMLLFAGFAWPYAWYLGNLEIVWAYVALAGLPFIRGFIHFDLYRRQRQMSFAATALVAVAGPAASLVATLVALLLFDNYVIMLVAMYVQQIALVAITHLIAERRYRIGWHWPTTVRALKFGIPLLLNGALVFATHNGDNLLVGGLIGMEALGWFYVATILTLTLSVNLDTSIRSAVLPGLAQAADDPARFQAISQDTLDYSVCGAILLVGFIYLFGPCMVILLFGEKYSEALPYLVPLAVIYAVRLVKITPNVQAIARAETLLTVYSNLPRGIAIFVAAAWITTIGGGIETILGIALVAEIICLVLSLNLATRKGRNGLPVAKLVLPITLGAVLFAVAALESGFGQSAACAIRPVQLPIAAAGFAALFLLPAVRRKVTAYLR